MSVHSSNRILEQLLHKYSLPPSETISPLKKEDKNKHKKIFKVLILKGLCYHKSRI